MCRSSSDFRPLSSHGYLCQMEGMSNPSRGSRVVSMAAGMVIGVATGLAIWLATELFVFFPVFIGIGLVLGLVFQDAAERRDRT